MIHILVFQLKDANFNGIHCAKSVSSLDVVVFPCSLYFLHLEEDREEGETT